MLFYVAGLIGLVSLTPALDHAAPAPEAAHPGGHAITRAADGQFYADVSVGPETIRMLLDPGASTMLLTPEDAARLGMSGSVTASATLAEVTLGPVGATQVDAGVMPDLPVSLLGRSFLEKVSVTVERDRMIIR